MSSKLVGISEAPTHASKNRRPSKPTPQPPAPHPGWIALVGAGPGAPDLLTVRAVRFLGLADLVLFDALVDPQILELAHPRAERVEVGKRGHRTSWKQCDISELLVSAALAGRNVVRLKGGDPFVFGRGGEEALAAAAVGIPVHVVPGVSAALAAPAAAGIPVTHRGLATHFTVVTGHAASGQDALRAQWSHLARAGGTLVFLMPQRHLADIAQTLIRAGRPATEPAALIADATRDSQQTHLTTLAALGAHEHRLTDGPATLVVGDVVLVPEVLNAALRDAAHAKTQPQA